MNKQDLPSLFRNGSQNHMMVTEIVTFGYIKNFVIANGMGKNVLNPSARVSAVRIKIRPYGWDIPYQDERKVTVFILTQ